MPISSSVRSLCFSSDSKQLIVGFHQGYLSAWYLNDSNPAAKQLPPLSDLTSVETVVCSSASPEVFAVGVTVKTS
jgi:hypothetical protein